jgi:hypothetical protein
MALFEGSHASLACPSDNSSIKMNMRMEYWWTNTNGGKPKNSEKNLSIATLSITNPVWTGPELYANLRSEKPATNR